MQTGSISNTANCYLFVLLTTCAPSSRISDKVPVREKMLYASTKDAVKKVMQGLQVDIHACDEDCLTENYFIEKTIK